jgi:hypothetical protein
MRRHALEWTLIATAAVMLTIAALRWRQSAPLVAAASQSTLARAHARPIAESLLAEAEEVAVRNDPFRLSNLPPDVRFDPRDEGASGSRMVAFVPLRPSLSLKGIMGGPPWQALIDGVPGQQPGVLVREGERFDKLMVRAVTRDSVVIQGPDTAWVLRFAARP